MKESLYYEPQTELSTEQTTKGKASQFETLNKAFLLGWGSILTYVIVIFGTVDPYRFDMVGSFVSGAIILWLLLLFVPGLCALTIWKWPPYQQIPLINRRSVILQGLALSWVTYLSFIVFLLAWSPNDTAFISGAVFIGLGLGLVLFFVARRLYFSTQEQEDLFP